jgi:XRE family transcriptional regulator, regulator of sulfur utilization
MTDDKASIERTAARLRKARQAQGLTQVAVAKKAGISETHYAQVERGEKNPTISIFLSIIEALDVASVDVLGK